MSPEGTWFALIVAAVSTGTSPPLLVCHWCDGAAAVLRSPLALAGSTGGCRGGGGTPAGSDGEDTVALLTKVSKNTNKSRRFDVHTRLFAFLSVPRLPNYP